MIKFIDIDEKEIKNKSFEIGDFIGWKMIKGNVFINDYVMDVIINWSGFFE